MAQQHKGWVYGPTICYMKRERHSQYAGTDLQANDECDACHTLSIALQICYTHKATIEQAEILRLRLRSGRHSSGEPFIVEASGEREEVVLKVEGRERERPRPRAGRRVDEKDIVGELQVAKGRVVGVERRARGDDDALVGGAGRVRAQAGGGLECIEEWRGGEHEASVHGQSE